MAKETLKVVVRLLPPEITEEELVATIPELHLQRTSWRSFQAGKRYKGEAKPSVNSRCYFLFDSEENADEFMKDYHGHQFVDGQGETFRAVVCFAPYSKVPRSKNSKDPRDGTIFDDALYKEFLEKLEKGAEYEAPENPRLALKPSNPKDTPLLNYMKDRAVERRAKAAKRERERQKWREDRLGRIAEDKKSKWRCTECGTYKNLEEDPDNRGTFYCTYCWESYEAKAAKKRKNNKKKGGSKDEEWEEEWPEEEEETTKKKKKKKKKSEEEWYEWEEEEEETTKKKKKKKKKAEEEEWYWEETTTKSSKKKGSKKESEEQWWVEAGKDDSESKPAKKKSSSRWKAKQSADAEEVQEEEKPEKSEKPRRKKKEESQWVPKLSKPGEDW